MTPANNTGKVGKKQSSGKQPRSSSPPPAAATANKITTPTTLKFPDAPTGFIPGVQKWCLKDIQVFSPSDSRLNTLRTGSIVTVRQTGAHPDGDPIPDRKWSKIEYADMTGWVDELYLDDYKQEFLGNEVMIEGQTPRTGDAQQFVVIDTQTKELLAEYPRDYDMQVARKLLQENHNMCGELCVAYIVGDRLRNVLEAWKKKDEAGYNKYVGMDLETEIGVLEQVLQAYDDASGEYHLEMEELLSNDGKAFARNGANSLRNKLQEKLPTHQLLVLVKSKVESTGELLAIQNRLVEERNHWVVVNALTHQGNCVQIYNPFQNRRESYSYNQFFDSCTRLKQTGLFVKRKDADSRPAAEIPIQRIAQVGIEAPGPAAGELARQYIRVDGIRQTELCGEFCVTYILTKSIDCILDYITQKETVETSKLVSLLKQYGLTDVKGFGIRTVLTRWKQAVIPEKTLQCVTYVPANKPTGVGVLKQILRLYGYSEKDFILFPQGLREVTSPTDPRFDKNYIPSIGRIRQQLKTHFLIAGVGIDASVDGRGRLKPSGGTRHWEVLEEIHPSGRHYRQFHREGEGGWVKLFNPFNNQMEEYSVLEFYRSMGMNAQQGLDGMGWLGLFVKRKPSFVEEQEKAAGPGTKMGVPGPSRSERRASIPPEEIPAKEKSLAGELAQKINDFENLLKQKARAALSEDEFLKQEKSLAEAMALKIADLEDVLASPANDGDMDDEYRKENTLAKEAALKIASAARQALASKATDIV